MKYIDVFTGEVVETKFGTQYLLPFQEQSEKPSSKTMTEMSYVPADIQVKEMLDAGARLDAYRKQRFGSELVEEGQDPEVDPTSEPGVDLVDIGKAAEAVNMRLEEQDAANRKKAVEEAEQAKKVAFDAAVEAEVAKRMGAQP